MPNYTLEYDLLYIGAGPATMFSLLHLVESGYKGNILVIEKGKSLKNRGPKEIISGSFGAGCYSDSKLTAAIDVGGIIPNLTQEELDEYGDKILSWLNKVSPTPLNWSQTNKFDTKDSTLNWNIHKTSHIGTENGQAIYKIIEDFLNSQSNIEFMFEYEVEDIIPLSNLGYQVIVKGIESQFVFLAQKVILATGQKSTLPSKIINNFNLESKPRALQLGVRVEDIMNPQYEAIIKANYDFKFEKNYSYNGVKVRVRTFCCNSGNAHTCAEKNSEGFVCFNGHAYKNPDPNNNTVNYGIICEVEGLLEYSTKEAQIELMKKVNSLKGWEKDNFKGEKVTPKRKLLKGFPQLEGIYPKEIIYSMESFIFSLNKLVDLTKAKYLYPEVKLSGNVPVLNSNYETKQKNLYMIGDCAISRGIVKAAITGIQFADYIIKEEIILNDIKD